MTKAVAVQHAMDAIRANSIHPDVLPAMRISGRNVDRTMRTERLRIIPIRRPGEANEVVDAIRLLASDGWSCMNGSEIRAVGGAIAV